MPGSPSGGSSKKSQDAASQGSTTPPRSPPNQRPGSPGSRSTHSSHRTGLSRSVADGAQLLKETIKGPRSPRNPLELAGSRIRGFLKLNWARVIDLFRTMDTSGDGHIDEDEFKVGFEALGLDVSEEAMGELFRLFDMDGNGTVEIQELDRAIHLLKKPEAKYGPHTIDKDGFSFGVLVPEMHGAKMDFLLTLDDPSARYPRDRYGPIGHTYITHHKAMETIQEKRIRDRATQHAQDIASAMTSSQFFSAKSAKGMNLNSNRGRCQTSSDFGKTGFRDFPSNPTALQRERDFVLDCNRSAINPNLPARAGYLPLFDPDMKDFFQKGGRRKAVQDNFYVEEITREQKKFMAMAAKQVAASRTEASFRLFGKQLDRVSDAIVQARYPQPDISIRRTARARRRRQNHSTSDPLAEMLYRPSTGHVLDRPPSLRSTAALPDSSFLIHDQRYSPAFRRSIGRAMDLASSSSVSS